MANFSLGILKIKETSVGKGSVFQTFVFNSIQKRLRHFFPQVRENKGVMPSRATSAVVLSETYR